MSITVNVQKAASVNAEVAHVLVEVPHVFRRAVSETAMATAMARTIPGARMLRGGFHKTEVAGLYGVFVATSRNTVPLEQASAQGFNRVSDTVFQDADDNIWEVQSDANGAFLMQSGTEDIAGLLQAVHVRAVTTASVGVSLEEHVNANEPVLYYDTVAECAAFGVGLGDNRVFNPETATVQHVMPATVLAVYTTPHDLEFAAAPKTGGLKAAMDYFTQLYGHNKEFLDKIKTILKEAVTA